MCQMFGVDRDELKSLIEGAPAHKVGDHGRLALSMLSDAQHHLESGDQDGARMMINRVKFLIDYYMRPGSAASASR